MLRTAKSSLSYRILTLSSRFQTLSSIEAHERWLVESQVGREVVHDWPWAVVSRIPYTPWFQGRVRSTRTNSAIEIGRDTMNEAGQWHDRPPLNTSTKTNERFSRCGRRKRSFMETDTFSGKLSVVSYKRKVNQSSPSSPRSIAFFNESINVLDPSVPCCLLRDLSSLVIWREIHRHIIISHLAGVKTRVAGW